MKIEPDKQFTASAESISQILSQYGLSFISYEEASTGIENSTIIVDTDKGKFVVRVYRQGKKSLNEINIEVDFVNYLRANDIKVPEILKNISGSFIATLTFNEAAWQAIVMRFIKGVHAESYTQQLIDELASTQANIHILATNYEQLNYEKQTTLSELRDTYFIKQIDCRNLKDQKLIDFIERGKKYRLLLNQNLPHGACHLDYDKENALTSNDSLKAILDFDDLENAPFIVCLSYTLWHVRQESGKDAMTRYLSKYESVRQLSELEKSYIQPIMLFRHYVISSIKILNKHLDANEVNKYLTIEAELLSTLDA